MKKNKKSRIEKVESRKRNDSSRRPATSDQRLSACFSSKKMDWETPQDLFDRLNAEFHFEWDVCASKDNAKCACFWTEKDNALGKSWKNKTCWMNPPYGWEIGLFMAKAYLESCEGATVVCLVPSRTDTAWWHNYAMKGEIRFLKGRLKFVGAASSAPFPSAVVVFRPKVTFNMRSQFLNDPLSFHRKYPRKIVIDKKILEEKSGKFHLPALLKHTRCHFWPCRQHTADNWCKVNDNDCEDRRVQPCY